MVLTCGRVSGWRAALRGPQLVKRSRLRLISPGALSGRPVGCNTGAGTALHCRLPSRCFALRTHGLAQMSQATLCGTRAGAGNAASTGRQAGAPVVALADSYTGCLEMMAPTQIGNGFHSSVSSKEQQQLLHRQLALTQQMPRSPESLMSNSSSHMSNRSNSKGPRSQESLMSNSSSSSSSSNSKVPRTQEWQFQPLP